LTTTVGKGQTKRTKRRKETRLCEPS